MRPNDLADDDGLVEVAAGRGQQHRIARRQMGVVEGIAEQARGGHADPTTDRERRPAVTGAVEIELSHGGEFQARRDILVSPVGPGLRP
jgi:hypothetical protein